MITEDIDTIKAVRYCGGVKIYIVFTPKSLTAKCASTDGNIVCTSEITLKVLEVGAGESPEVQLDSTMDLIATAVLDVAIEDRPNAFKKSLEKREGKWVISPWPKGTLLN